MPNPRLEPTQTEMDETIRPKMKTISVLVDGRNCYQKVTENTTCGDVIQHLLKHSGLKKNNKDSYFLFASNNITEQRLSKKIKVLKVAEDLASGTNRLNFILRKKIRIRVPDVSAITRRRLREKSSAKELKVKKVEPMPYAPVRAPKQIRGVNQLCELVQVPKRRLIESDEKLNDTVKFTKQSMEKNTSFMNKSKAYINLDQFPGNVNDENMNGLLSFCDTVTTKKMENLPSALPRSSSVDRSIIDDHMTLMTCKFDRKFVDHATETLDGKLNTIMNAICHSKFKTTEDDVANDNLILEDGLYYEDDDQVLFATMSLPQRVASTDQRRTRRNVKPVHSSPLVNKTMVYLNRSRNRTRMTRQFGTSQLLLDKLANLQPQEIQRRDSYLSRRADGALSMLICHRKPPFSKEKEGYKYFREHRYVSKFDENLDHTLLDKELDKAFDSNSDVSINCSNHSASSSNVISGNIQSNDRCHSVLHFDSSSRVMSYVQDGQEDANDCLSVQTLKMKLVDYSLSDAKDCLSVQTLKMKLVDYSLGDSDISSVASESV